MLIRAISSIAIVALGAISQNIIAPPTMLAAGKLAGDQLKADDAAYLISTYGGYALGMPSIMISTITIFLLLMIWYRPVLNLVKRLFPALMAVSVIIFGCGTPPASAYYDKADWPEIYFILPDESAVWVPSVGDNAASQVSFGSEAYLRANKIAAKQFSIPHTKLPKSSYLSDFYVPAGRMVIINRTPYAEQWTKSETRGTSAKDQAIVCQSKEGLDIVIEVSIAASVTEDDAYRYLYKFGVIRPVGERTSPEVQFASVFFSKPLATVMPTIVRGKVQSILCSKVGAKSLDDASASASAIMLETEKELKEYSLKELGITIEYIGYGGTMEFSGVVQKALDDRYAAEKVQPVLTTLQAQADLKLKEGLAKALGEKGIPMPQNLIAIPEKLLDFSKMFSAQDKGAGK